MPAHKVTEESELSAKQLAFVRYFVEGNDAKQAAELAGYSKKSAKALGSKLAQKPHIQAAIAREREKLNKRTHRNLDDVVAEIEKIAFTDLVKDGLIKDKTKLEALKTLGQHLGMFSGSDELKLQRAIEQLVARLRERVPVEAYDRLVEAFAAEMGLPSLGQQAASPPAADEGSAGPTTH
jgi:phage terminase small subunit